MRFFDNLVVATFWPPCIDVSTGSTIRMATTTIFSKQLFSDAEHRLTETIALRKKLLTTLFWSLFIVSSVRDRESMIYAEAEVDKHVQSIGLILYISEK